MLPSRATLEIPVAAEMVAADVTQVIPDRKGAFVFTGRVGWLLAALIVLGALAVIMLLLAPAEAAEAEFGAKADYRAGKAAPAKSKKGKDKEGKEEKAEDTEAVGVLRKGDPGEPSYYTLPDILVNLASQEGRPYFLKLKLTLEAEDYHTFDGVPKIMPRLTDSLLLFLRELHIDDLNGTAGGYRLRLELLRRLNKAIAPRQINAVLIEEMLVQ